MLAWRERGELQSLTACWATQTFKIQALRDVQNLFPMETNPFYAGFGNRPTDVMAYKSVGIADGKIFIINPTVCGRGRRVAMLRRLVAFAAWGVGGRAGSSPRPRFASMCIAAPSLAPKEREALARRCALHACSLSLTTAPRDPPLVLVSGLAAHQVGFFCGEQ